MKIVIIHYHLKTGGVTSVIARHAKALVSDQNQVLVICGQKPRQRWDVPVTVIDELAYDTVRKKPADPLVAADKIQAAIDHTWPEGCDLIHVHNPTLAKNASLLQCLEILQSRGLRLLLQIHDFAEDGRPDVFFRQDYPSGCHYGVINSRDYRIMLAAGLTPPGLHLVPNPVSSLPRAEGRLPFQDDFAVYPVRAIRRKNIGEALLVSLFLRPGTKLAITQPPNSPLDFIVYEKWRRLAQAWNLPVIFEAGIKYDFGALMARCAFVLTTSINEGFGFVYLEPWTGGKPVWGRRIDDICADFSKNGIALDNLYSRLEVPLNLFDYQAYRLRWEKAFNAAWESYGMPGPLSSQAGCDSLIKDGCIDFGMLDEKAQQQILSMVRGSALGKDAILRVNPLLAKDWSKGLTEKTIAANRRAVKANYVDLDLAGTLTRIYRKVTDCRVNQAIDKTRLLASFLVPENFSLLKWSRPDGR